MLEIELKFPAADFAPIEAKLAQWQAQPADVLHEADHYYNAPDRDFAKTDEALRLRRIGEANVLTYKGPKQAGPAKTRTEIEVGLEAGAEAAEQFCKLLTSLGYRAVAVVRKKRRPFPFERDGFALEACLDEVEQVGRFVELEIIAPEEKKAQAEELLGQLAADLGLTHAERRSYLEMYLRALGRLE